MIGAIGNEAFSQQTSLRSLNMSHNVIANIDMTAFKGLNQLQKLDLSFNKISRLSERLFQGIRKDRRESDWIFSWTCRFSFCTDVSMLQDVDLSNNFLSSIPTSLTGLPSLKRLSLSANLIQVSCTPMFLRKYGTLTVILCDYRTWIVELWVNCPVWNIWTSPGTT